MNRTPPLIQPAMDADAADWRRLFADYCRFYSVSLADGTVEEVWRRILDPGSPTKALLARDQAGQAVGLCNYVLHQNTWGTAPVCYLEDLYTVPEVRGRGIGGALIRHLLDLGRRTGWQRVYWHTDQDNATARLLYDRITGGRDSFVRYMVRLPVGV